MADHVPRPTLRRAARPALLAALGVLHLAVVASIVWQTRPVIWPLHNDTIHRAGRGADFHAVYHAATMWRDGRSPYGNEPDGVTPYFYPFRYLPVAAWAATPLTAFSPSVAYLLWIVALEALLAVLLAVLWRHIDGDAMRFGAVALLLMSTPYFLELYMGQFTFATVALCLLGFLVARADPSGGTSSSAKGTSAAGTTTEKATAAGATADTSPSGRACVVAATLIGTGLYTASILLKPFPLATLPALASRRRYWVLGLTAVSALMLVSVPYFVFHPADWEHFRTANFNVGGAYDSGNYGCLHAARLTAQRLDWDGALEHWDRLATAGRWLLLGAVAAIVALSRRDTLLGVCLLLLAHFVTYPQVWEHHASGVILIGAGMLAVPSLSQRSKAAALACMAVLALPTPLGLIDVAKDPAVWNPAEQWSWSARMIVVLPKALPTLAMLAVCLGPFLADIMQAARRPRRDGVPGEGEPVLFGFLGDAVARGEEATTMSKNQRPTARKPATKFAQLQKKLRKQKAQPAKPKKA